MLLNILPGSHRSRFLERQSHCLPRRHPDEKGEPSVGGEGLGAKRSSLSNRKICWARRIISVQYSQLLCAMFSVGMGRGVGVEAESRKRETTRVRQRLNYVAGYCLVTCRDEEAAYWLFVAIFKRVRDF